MNWTVIFKYFGLMTVIAESLEAISVEIAAGQSASTPPLSTYIGGKHGTIVVTWTPTP